MLKDLPPKSLNAAGPGQGVLPRQILLPAYLSQAHTTQPTRLHTFFLFILCFIWNDEPGTEPTGKNRTRTFMSILTLAAMMWTVTSFPGTLLSMA